MSRIILHWRNGGAKSVNPEVSLDGPKRLGQEVSYDMDKRGQGLTLGKICNIYVQHKGKAFIAKQRRVN
jgi:hypothetical protein